MQNVGSNRCFLPALLVCLAVVPLKAAERPAAPSDGEIVVDSGPWAKARGGNGKVVDDPKSATGKALSFHNENASSTGPAKVDLKPGRYRFTISARHESGKKFKLKLGASGQKWSNAFIFFFGAGAKDSKYQQQSVEWIIPGPGTVSLHGVKFQTGELIERLVITPVAGGSLLEVLDVETDRLVYKPGEIPCVTVQLRNSAATAAKPTLRVVVESGLSAETVVTEQPVELPASSGAVPVKVPLKAAVPEWGSLVRAELVVDGKVVACNRTACATTEQPFRVGQYGIIGGDAPYEAQGIDAAIDQFRRTYCSAVEIAFWAPCDMSMLTPPPGKDRWWSGQTYKKISTGQMRTYARKLHEQGMAFLGYATFSNIFGYRICDWGRRFPEGLDWNARAEDGYVWWGWGQQKVRLGAPARTEDDTLTDMKASGVARSLHTQPVALKWHADQLVAGMKEFGLDGYRYDDNLEYDGNQVDILGRRGPFPGWGTDEIFTYFRQRLLAANPRALFGHNSDPMRTGGDNMYSKHLDHPEKIDELEAALFRGGSLGLQEAYTKGPGGKATWVQWRDRNELAGRSAHRNGGVLASITTFAGEPKSMTAIMLASGNRVAYTGLEAHRPYLAFATRYSQFLYNADLRWLPQDEARRTVTVGAGGREVWWAPWVRFLPAAPGKRVYLVHLINPPIGTTFEESDPADPVKEIAVRLSLPRGWKAQRAWQLTADHDDALASEIIRSRVVAGVAKQEEKGEKVQLSFAAGYPAATSLKVDGSAITVPYLDCWSLLAIECEGPAADAVPLDLRPARPAPPVPALEPPTVVERATDLEMFFRRWEPGWQVLKPGTPLEMKLKPSYGPHDLNPHVWAAGRYRVTVEYSAPQSASGKLSLTIAVKPRSASVARKGQSEGVPALPAFEAKADWPLVTTAAGKPGVLSREMAWGEMAGQIPLVFSADAEISLTGLKIECLELFDTERLKLWGNGWPAGGKITPGESGFYNAEGLYGDYFGLGKVLGAMPGTKTETGYAWMLGQHWGGLNTLGKIESRQLIALSDVAIWRFTPPQLDQLRGWVEAGGRLVMTGGPYGFGRGGWGLSDLMRPMYPAELAGAFDLQPVNATLTPVSPLAKQVDFSGAPAVMWQHLMKSKPDATVHVTAGGNPVIVSRRYGKGKVCFIALAPLGDAPSGKTAFWTWDGWPKLMEAVIKDVLR